MSADPKSAPKPADVDRIDLALARTELDAGGAMLAAAHDVVDRRERREAMKAALSKLALANRMLTELINRRS